MGRKPKIKPLEPRRGGRVLGPETASDHLPIAFSFGATAPRYGLADLTDDQLLAFMKAIKKRCNGTWDQLNQAPHTGMGFEPIKTSQIRVPIPPSVPSDKTIRSIRCGGPAGLFRMIGYRNDQVFVVVWLDCLGKVYDHGS